MKPALLIHAGAIGDFILALRVIQAILAAGHDEIVLLGRPAIARLAIGSFPLKILDIETGGQHALFSDTLPLPESLRAELTGVTLAVDMLGGPDTCIGRRLGEAGVQTVIGIDPRPRPGDTRHITDQWLDVLRLPGLPVELPPPRLWVSPPLSAAATTTLGTMLDTTQRPLILHPGSGGARKCPPLEKFISLAQRFRAAGRSAAFLIGPVEEERFSADELQAMTNVAPILRSIPLLELPAILAQAAAFVGNDGGITHLAAAVGTRVIAIFGPTDPRVWRPLGPLVTTLRACDALRWPGVEEILAACSADA